jgi:hypothetical protein
MDKNKAAKIIQKAYRHYTDKRIFRYYKELIAFHNQGDPSHLLKGINPAEGKLNVLFVSFLIIAALLDPAIGARVRFRLGGTRFPPMMYYK